MPFPSPGWPPRPASGRRSIRFFAEGTATNAFGDNAWLFIQAVSANTFSPTPYVRPGSTDPVAIGDIARAGSPMGGRQIAEDAAPPTHENPPATQEQANYPQVWSIGIRVYNRTIAGDPGAGDLAFSFDGVNTHGVVKPGETVVYQNRHEAGICVQGVGVAVPEFAVEAW